LADQDSGGAVAREPIEVATIVTEGVSVAEGQRDLDRFVRNMEQYEMLRAVLASIRTAKASSQIKNAHTVLAFMNFLAADPAMRESGDERLLMNLLEPTSANILKSVARGNLAIPYAALITGGMELAEAVLWLDRAFKDRTLPYTGKDAQRWFRDINENRATGPQKAMFDESRKALSRLKTLDDAKRLATDCLNVAKRFHAAPLKQNPRRSR